MISSLLELSGKTISGSSLGHPARDVRVSGRRGPNLPPARAAGRDGLLEALERRLDASDLYVNVVPERDALLVSSIALLVARRRKKKQL